MVGKRDENLYDRIARLQKPNEDPTPDEVYQYNYNKLKQEYEMERKKREMVRNHNLRIIRMQREYEARQDPKYDK